MVYSERAMSQSKTYRNLSEFYPFYLDQHANRLCRRLHFVGTAISLVLIVTALITRAWWLIAIAFVEGYAFAWIGHFFFEHNKPATFKYPWLSFISDWRLSFDILTGKIRF